MSYCSSGRRLGAGGAVRAMDGVCQAGAPAGHGSGDPGRAAGLAGRVFHDEVRGPPAPAANGPGTAAGGIIPACRGHGPPGRRPHPGRAGAARPGARPEARETAARPEGGTRG